MDTRCYVSNLVPRPFPVFSLLHTCNIKKLGVAWGRGYSVPFYDLQFTNLSLYLYSEWVEMPLVPNQDFYFLVLFYTSSPLMFLSQCQNACMCSKQRASRSHARSTPQQQAPLTSILHMVSAQYADNCEFWQSAHGCLAMYITNFF